MTFLDASAGTGTGVVSLFTVPFIAVGKDLSGAMLSVLLDLCGADVPNS